MSSKVGKDFFEKLRSGQTQVEPVPSQENRPSSSAKVDPSFFGKLREDPVKQESAESESPSLSQIFLPSLSALESQPQVAPSFDVDFQPKQLIEAEGGGLINKPSTFIPVLEMKNGKLIAKPPVEQEELPTLTVQGSDPTQGGLALLAGVGDLLGIPVRLLGAAFNKPEGKTFLQEMANPEAGIGRQLKKIIRESDQPAAAKFMEELLVSIGEDPLSFFGVGTIKSAVKSAKKLSTKGAKKPELPGIKIGDEVKKQLKIKPELEIPIAQNTTIPLTPVQKKITGGEDASAALRIREKKASLKSPETKAKIEQGQSDEIAERLKMIRVSNGLDSFGQETLTEGLEKGVGNAISKFRAKADGLYKGINNVSESVIDKSSKDIVKKRIADLGASQKEPGNIQDILQASVGKGGVSPELLASLTGKVKLTTKDMAGDLGVQPSTLIAIQRISKRMDKDITFEAMKKNRSTIITEIKKIRKITGGGGGTDVKLLLETKDALTEGMANHLKGTLKNPKLVDEWMKADAFFSEGTDAIEVAKKMFYKSSNVRRSSKEIIDEFAKIPPKRKGTVLDNLMEVMDDETLHTLKNMYFNDIIKRATKKSGEISSADLKNVLDAQPYAVFNRVFDKKMKEQIGQLLTDVVAKDFASQIKILEKTPRPFIEKVLSSSSSAHRLWAIMHGITRGGLNVTKAAVGFATLGTVTAISELVIKGLKDRGVRKAQEFLLDTSKPIKPKLKKFIVEGFPETVTRGAARTVLPTSEDPSLEPTP